MSDELRVDARYLLRKRYSDNVQEHLIQEISPSGARFKSHDQWHAIDDYVIAEELPRYAPNEMPDLA